MCFQPNNDYLEITMHTHKHALEKNNKRGYEANYRKAWETLKLMGQTHEGDALFLTNHGIPCGCFWNLQPYGYRP